MNKVVGSFFSQVVVVGCMMSLVVPMWSVAGWIQLLQLPSLPAAIHHHPHQRSTTTTTTTTTLYEKPTYFYDQPEEYDDDDDEYYGYHDNNSNDHRLYADRDDYSDRDPFLHSNDEIRPVPQFPQRPRRLAFDSKQRQEKPANPDVIIPRQQQEGKKLHYFFNQEEEEEDNDTSTLNDYRYSTQGEGGGDRRRYEDEERFDERRFEEEEEERFREPYYDNYDREPYEDYGIRDDDQNGDLRYSSHSPPDVKDDNPYADSLVQNPFSGESRRMRRGEESSSSSRRSNRHASTDPFFNSNDAIKPVTAEEKKPRRLAFPNLSEEAFYRGSDGGGPDVNAEGRMEQPPPFSVSDEMPPDDARRFFISQQQQEEEEEEHFRGDMRDPPNMDHFADRHGIPPHLLKRDLENQRERNDSDFMHTNNDPTAYGVRPPPPPPMEKVPKYRYAPPTDPSASDNDGPAGRGDDSLRTEDRSRDSGATGDTMVEPPTQSRMARQLKFVEDDFQPPHDLDLPGNESPKQDDSSDDEDQRRQRMEKQIRAGIVCDDDMYALGKQAVSFSGVRSKWEDPESIRRSEVIAETTAATSKKDTKTEKSLNVDASTEAAAATARSGSGNKPPSNIDSKEKGSNTTSSANATAPGVASPKGSTRSGFTVANFGQEKNPSAKPSVGASPPKDAPQKAVTREDPSLRSSALKTGDPDPTGSSGAIPMPPAASKSSQKNSLSTLKEESDQNKNRSPDVNRMPPVTPKSTGMGDPGPTVSTLKREEDQKEKRSAGPIPMPPASPKSTGKNGSAGTLNKESDPNAKRSADATPVPAPAPEKNEPTPMNSGIGKESGANTENYSDFASKPNAPREDGRSGYSDYSDFASKAPVSGESDRRDPLVSTPLNAGQIRTLGSKEQSLGASVSNEKEGQNLNRASGASPMPPFAPESSRRNEATPSFPNVGKDKDAHTRTDSDFAAATGERSGRTDPAPVLSDVKNDNSSTTKADSEAVASTEEPATGSTRRDGPLPIHHSVQTPAGVLYDEAKLLRHDDDTTRTLPHRGQSRKRVLVLCTGGTLTMSNDPAQGNSMAPVQGALTDYLAAMRELTEDPEMPEIIAHEYTPLIDSSDMGPGDWAVLAKDIAANYYHFDGFVVLMGTDTMAYAASALTFMFQNLGKPIVFTGSQIPLREPYNDARKNLIMATIFASSDTVSEVTIFFHDRLLRACRATKVNTSKLLAFDSPNLDPLAEIGIHIEERDYLYPPPPKGSFRLRTEMDTRLITLRLVPGFDDAMIMQMINAARETHLKGLILQLYGTGNLPSLKDELIHCLSEASKAGVCVVVTTQCQTGSVLLGHYATGQALKKAGVVSACDMTLEATTTKLAYLLGRQDLSIDEVRDLIGVNLRGEMTPQEQLPPPPLASTYQKAIARKNRSRVL